MQDIKEPVLKRRKYILTFIIILILVSSTAALTWMWLSNTIEDDVEVTDRPMTLTLLESPDGIWKGSLSTWAFNLSVDYGVVTRCNFYIRVSWDKYNSSDDYTGLVERNFNNTDWGGVIGNMPDHLMFMTQMFESDGVYDYQWQAGYSTWFTVDIIIHTPMPVGNYHFEFVVSGQLV